MPEFDAPSADVRLPSPAEEQAAEALRARLRAAFPPGRAYTLADLQTPAMPAAVARFIVQALQRRLVMERETLREARSAWFDHDAPAVEAAWDDLVDALGAHARVPADEWPRALDQAAGQVASFLLRPAPTLAAFVFADDAPDLPVGVILRRMSYFTSYPYLRDVVAAYVEQRGLDRLDRATFASLLGRVERRTPSAYRGQWTTLFADLYATLGTGTPPTMPAVLLAPTLADRGLTALAHQLATYDGALTLDDLARIVDADPAGSRSAASPDTPAAAAPPPAPFTDASPSLPRADAAPNVDAARADADAPPLTLQEDGAGTFERPDNALASDADADADVDVRRDVGAEEDRSDAAFGGDDQPHAGGWDAPSSDETDHPDRGLTALAASAAAPDGATWPTEAAPVPDAGIDADVASDGPAFDWRGLPDSPTATNADAALDHDIPEPALSGIPVHPPLDPTSIPSNEAAGADPHRGSTLPGSLHDAAASGSVTMPETPAPEPASTGTGNDLAPTVDIRDTPVRDAPVRDAPPSDDPALPDALAGGSPRPVEPSRLSPEPSSPEPARAASLADRPVSALDPLPPVASRAPTSDISDDERPLWQRVLRREAPPAPPAGRADDLDALEARTLGTGARARRDSFVSGLFGGDAGAYATALAQLDAVTSWTDAAGVLLGLFRSRGVDLYDPIAVAFTDAAEQRYL